MPATRMRHLRRQDCPADYHSKGGTLLKTALLLCLMLSTPAFLASASCIGKPQTTLTQKSDPNNSPPACPGSIITDLSHLKTMLCNCICIAALCSSDLHPHKSAADTTTDPSPSIARNLILPQSPAQTSNPSAFRDALLTPLCPSFQYYLS